VDLEDQLRILVGVGLTGLLVLLRLDAYRFGAAEHDDESNSAAGGAGRRLAWYGTGVALALAIWHVFLTPVTTLHPNIGADRVETLTLGLIFGGIGTLVAVVYAWLRYRRLRCRSTATTQGGGQRHRHRLHRRGLLSRCDPASRWHSAADRSGHRLPGRPRWHHDAPGHRASRHAAHRPRHRRRGGFLMV
jgi:hypothetical protein